ncbi:MAG: MFS transporter [Actinobacteria bacterium]|nr:MFS transporter [Actinomycetota bacterium]
MARAVEEDARAVGSPVKPGLRDALAAFHYRNFTLFFAGAVLSNSGTWMQIIAVQYVVFQLTGSTFMLGVAGFLQLLPIVFLGPIGGWLADRFARRRVLLVTQGLAAGEALVLWAVWARGSDSLAALLVLVAISGVITGLNIPSWQAFISELVPRDALLNAVTLNSTQFNAARALGPAVGGAVLAGLGASAAFLLNAISYVAVIGALVLIKLPRPVDRPYTAVGPPKRRIIGDFFDAARATRSYPGIRACFFAVVALGLLGAPLASLLAAFADQVFRVDATRYGFLGAALGIGSIIAAPFIAGPGSGVRRSKLLLVSMVAYGTALVAFAATSSYAFAIFALAVSSAGYLGIASTLNTTIQLQVAESIRGKVLALYVMLLTLAMPVGLLIQGTAAEWFGLQATVIVAGLLFVAVTVWLARFSGLFGHLDDDGPLGSAGASCPTPSEGIDGSVDVEEGLPLGARPEGGAPAAGGARQLAGDGPAVQQAGEAERATDRALDRRV